MGGVPESLHTRRMSVGELSKLQADLDALIQRGNDLWMAIQYECYPEDFKAAAEAKIGKDKIADYLKGLPSFKSEYQIWYSEVQAVVKQLLPGRLDDLKRLYEKPSGRKELSHGNYVIHDYLQGLCRKGSYEQVIVSASSAIPQFEQQLHILRACKQRLKSSLFDIRQMVQADLLDSEIDAARELAKNRYLRAAGAMAGVVLERHLLSVCESHNLKICLSG